MAEFIKTQTGQLSNGMQVEYMHLPRCKQMLLRVDVPVGAHHDPRGKEGISHILEHTVFCGTENVPEKELFDQLRKIGGGSNAGTTPDRTNFDLWASARNPENFATIADLMRQILTEPVFPPERIEIEKNVIINERADDLDNLQYGSMLEANRIIYRGDHPDTNIIGTVGSILSVGSEDLRAFMQDEYDGGAMTVYAASPLSFEEAMSALEQTLSAVPNKGLKEKPRYNPPYGVSDERVLRSDLLQNYTALMFVTPAGKTVRDLYAFNIAKSLVSSIAVHELRMKHGCFYAPEMMGWHTTETHALTAMRMSSTPEDSVVAITELAQFANEIDDHLTDDAIQAEIDGFVDFYSDPELFTTGILTEVRWLKNTNGIQFDSRESLKAYAQMTPDDVRDHAKALMAGLTGMFVQGPKPNEPPRLEALKSMMPSSAEQGISGLFNGPRVSV